MCARFVFLVFFKNIIFHFSYQNSSHILREYLYKSLRKRGQIKNLIYTIRFNIYFKPHNFEICNTISLPINQGQQNWPSNTNLLNKTGGDLVLLVILQRQLHLTHIVIIILMKKIMKKINNHSTQRHIIVQTLLSKMQLMI